MLIDHDELFIKIIQLLTKFKNIINSDVNSNSVQDDREDINDDDDLAPVDIQAGDETNGIENNENPPNMNQIESEKQSDVESSNLNLAEIQANSFLQSIQLPELEKQREAILSELGMISNKKSTITIFGHK